MPCLANDRVRHFKIADVGEGKHLDRDGRADLLCILAEACEGLGIARNVAALLVELSADLDVPRLKLGRGFKKVLADPIRCGPLLPGLEPVDKKLDLEMDDAVVAANPAHPGEADFVPDRDEILMDDTEAGIAGPGRRFDPITKRQRADLGRSIRIGIASERPVAC